MYIVKVGDSLWDIARKFYTTVDEICSVNSLTEKEVKPGQPLITGKTGAELKKISIKIEDHILKTVVKCFKICTKIFIVYKVQRISGGFYAFTCIG